VNLTWTEAFLRGVYCNALVCLAVWLGYSARTTTDKILCVLFPITAFVAAGLEHSIANMYFIPMGLFLCDDAAVVAAANKTGADFVRQRRAHVGAHIVDGAVLPALDEVGGSKCLVAPRA
jgi:formate/nitrite transporter FocA (FNT family)